MNLRHYFHAAISLLVFVVWSVAFGQTTQTSSVQGTAGGTASAGTTTLVATVGQPSPIGQATAGAFTLSSGFIYTLDVASIAVATVTSPVEIGKSAPITWTVTGGAVANVKIELSRDNGATFQTLMASTTNDGNENLVLRAPCTNQNIIQISDVSSGALSGRSNVFALSPETFTTVSTSIAGGTAQSAYRMISFPATLTNPDPKTILEATLGTYDNTKWRLYDYVNGGFVEYPGTRTFISSRALFLISSTNKPINTGAGAYGCDVATVINLVAGWNMIGNPYNFSISTSALSLGNADVLTLRTYEGSWSNPVTAIEPFKGYAINASSATTLTIRPNFSGAASEPLAKTEEAPLWAMQIKAQCQEARDENNFIGLAANAKTAWDGRDLYEPPPIGEFVAVDFPHEDWAERADRYTTDFRPEGSASDGYIWEMAVRSNIQDRVFLTFEHLTEVPPEMQIYLVDESAKTAQDVRANPRYTLLPLANAKEKHLKLVAGPAKFVEKTVAALAPVPEAFELSPNYPNPFNPETAIRFGLPEKSLVSLKIFDLAGREVVTLLANEEFPAGRHQRLWNGRDQQGHQVGSGVYFYRFTAGSFTRTMKLTLVR